jgi:membrane-bound lytic murein transglycosylase B
MRLPNVRRARVTALVPLAVLSTAWTTLEVRGDVPALASSDGAAAPSRPVATSTLVPPVMPSLPAQVTTAPSANIPPASLTTTTDGPRGAQSAVAPPSFRAREAATILDETGNSAIPAVALAAYQRAANIIDTANPTCGLDWELLAAIGRVESDHGSTGGSQLTTSGVATPPIYGPVLNGRHHTQRITDTDGGKLDGNKRFDRAVGPMQILPSTWLTIAVDGDGDGQRNPQDINDAALASAVYLCSAGTDLSAQDTARSAVLRYNHSTSYAAMVLTLAAAYRAGDYSAPVSTVPVGYVLDSGAPAGEGTAPHGKGHHGHHHPAAHGGHPHHGKAKSAGHGDAASSAPAQSSTSGPSQSPGTSPSQDPSQTPSQDPSQTSSQDPSQSPGAGPSQSPVPATDTELATLCEQKLTAAYPAATGDALSQATTQCVAQLDGLTLDQARAKVDDVVTQLGTSVPGLTLTPSTSASESSSTEPSDTSSASSSSASSSSTP